MTDPLKVLRSPLLPVDPDPEFAANLRARLQRPVAPERSQHVYHQQRAPQQHPPRCRQAP